MGEPRVEWLTVAGDADAWRSIGLTVAADGSVPLFGTSLRIVAADDDTGVTGDTGMTGMTGMTGWAISGIAPTTEISGLPTEVVAPTSPSYADHPLGARDLDHIVIVTDALEATCAALADATGCELKRICDIGTMRQGFHRIGRNGLIVELVERVDPDDRPAEGAPPTNSFWGLVINVDDLDTAYDRLGDDVMSAPIDAVQPGRRIATIRRDVGLGTAVALMTRDPR